MTEFLVDVSKYQGPGALDGFAGAILNVEDPTLQQKVDRAQQLGIPWDVYKWCYPGQNGGAQLARAQQIVAGLHFEGRAPKFWLDYEESGVTGNQVREWFDAGGDGWYCYLYLLNAQGNHAPDKPLWLAYYPSSSADWYPNYSDTARAKGAKIHQYTSTGGSLDRNVILDDAWWAEWTEDGLNEQQTRDIAKQEAEAAVESFISNRAYGVTPFENQVDQYLNTPTGFGLTRVGLWVLADVKKYADKFKQALGI